MLRCVFYSFCYSCVLSFVIHVSDVLKLLARFLHDCLFCNMNLNMALPHDEDDAELWENLFSKDFTDCMWETARTAWKLADAEEATADVEEDVAAQRKQAVQFMKHTMHWSSDVLHDAVRAVGLLPPEPPSLWNYDCLMYMAMLWTMLFTSL